MTRWMRAELIAQTHHKHVFSTLAARAIEVNMPPVPPFTGPNLRDGIGAVVLAPKYGVRLELPHAVNAEIQGEIALSTLAPARTAHLFDADMRRRGEFAFTPA
eukprot:7153494-Prymnesium_polylepis.1